MRPANIDWVLDDDGLPALPIGGARGISTAIAYLEALCKWTTKANSQVAKVRIAGMQQAIKAMQVRDQIKGRKDKAKADALCKTRSASIGGLRPPSLTMPPPPPKQGGSKT